MKRIVAVVALGMGVRCLGAEVLVLASGNVASDELLVAVLEDAGHVVSIGPPYYQFDAGTVIGEFDVVYLQTNYNWGVGDMPADGQQKLLDFLELGGGLVTCEWLMWKVVTYPQFMLLEPVFPTTGGSYLTSASTTYTQSTPDDVLNAGLPKAFTFPNAFIGGSETFLTAKQGATVYYASDQVGVGVVGWSAGGGRVLSLSNVAGAESIADPDFGTFMANVMTWAAGDGNVGCVADCNDDLLLNILDFVCFQQLFQAGAPGADVNGDGQLNILDFVAFQQLFVEGCL